MSRKKYTETHEWVECEEQNHSVGVIGISKFAQEELGEIVYVKFPEVGERASSGKEVVILESTKAAIDVYSPVSGKVIEVNQAALQDPKVINHSPEDKGWLFKVHLDNPEELSCLMDASAYAKMH